MASASGKFATAPMRIVRMPATSAVTTAIVANPEPGVDPPPRYLPSASATPARMIGLRTMMYAIVRNVTTPPRTSCTTDESRSLILK